MITYAWRTELEADEAAEVHDLVTEAAEYDDEAGFTRVVPIASGAGTRSTQLLVRIHPVGIDEADDVRWPLAAYLRVDLSAGTGTVQLVVRPEFRSLGVATLVFEKLGLPPTGPAGWCGTGAAALRAWAHGDHPAADRMARRFGAARVRHMWNLLKSLGVPGESDYRDIMTNGITVRPADVRDDIAAVERVENAGDGWVSPSGREHLLAGSDTLLAVNGSGDVVGVLRLNSGNSNGSPGKAVGTILTLSVLPGVAREAGRALLGASLNHFRQLGVRKVQLYVDAEEEIIVRLTRELSFEHDRSDVCYVLGESL